MARVKKEYERIETFYEGENGGPWVAWYKAKEADGWEMESAQVTKQIDDRRFRGKVCFRREVTSVAEAAPVKQVSLAYAQPLNGEEKA